MAPINPLNMGIAIMIALPSVFILLIWALITKINVKQHRAHRQVSKGASFEDSAMRYTIYEVTKNELIKIDRVKATNSDIAIKKALIGKKRDPKKKYFSIHD